jgi:N-acetylneuraminic acid mutarotase
MRKQIVGLGIVFYLFLVGCTDGQQGTTRQDNKKFTERMAGSAESVNGVLYVMGGMSLSANLPDVGAYDPSRKSWTPKTAIPTPRSLGASVVLGNDIYVIGGRNETAVLSTVEKYSTTENKWSSAAPMPTARWSLMTCPAGGKIYAFGGLSGLGNSRRALNIVEAYDPNNNSWESIGNMSEARQGAAIAEVNGLIYVISGKIASYVEATTSEQITEHVDSFDPKMRAWKRLQDIPTGRVGARAVVANNLIFVVGGIAKSGEFPTQTDVFDPSSNQWSAGPHLSSGRSAHMSALVGDSIIVFGGTSVAYGGGRPSINGAMETVSVASYQQKPGGQ